MNQNLPLNALRTFEAVAANMSFTVGAKALNVTPAAVSSQIRMLEDLLHTPLFLRQGRKIELTAAGMALLPGVQAGLAQIREAVRHTRSQNDTGVLNVSLLPSFLQKWLTPRLHEFYARYTDIDLRINADANPVNFAETDFHAAIRFGRGDWPGLKSSMLLKDWQVVVCSPELMTRYGRVDSPDKLEKYPLLNSTDEPWENWFAKLDGNINRKRGPVFNDSISIVIAAQQGLGLALTRWSLVAAELESGQLVQPIDTALRSQFSYYFVAPAHNFDIPKVVKFRHWLEECCSAFPTPR